MAKKDKITGVWSTNGFTSIWTAEKRGKRVQGFWEYRNRVSPYNLAPDVPVVKGRLFIDLDQNGRFDAKVDKRLGRFKADMREERVPNIASGDIVFRPSKDKFKMFYDDDLFAKGVLREMASEFLAV